MKKELIFLGTGTSRGVPLLGCHCKTCDSADRRDKRLRSSVAVRSDHGGLLIDCGPDLRQQLLRENMIAFDAILLTHTHGDHIFGIDDLQMITQYHRRELPFYGSRRDIEAVRGMFPYIDALKYDGTGTDILEQGLRWSVPQLKYCPWEDTTTPVAIGDFQVRPIPMMHGKNAATGYRIDNMAYLSDCSFLPEEAYPLLENLDVLVIDGLRWNKPHPTHFCIEQALEEIARIKPHRAYLTHLTHDVLQERDEKNLPDGVYLPYDGLHVELT